MAFCITTRRVRHASDHACTQSSNCSYVLGPDRDEAVEDMRKRKHLGRVSMAECYEVMRWDACSFVIAQRERNLKGATKLLKTIKPPTHASPDTAFGLRTPHRTWLMCSPEGETALAWVEAIQRQCSQQWKGAAIARRNSMPVQVNPKKNTGSYAQARRATSVEAALSTQMLRKTVEAAVAPARTEVEEQIPQPPPRLKRPTIPQLQTQLQPQVRQTPAWAGLDAQESGSDVSESGWTSSEEEPEAASAKTNPVTSAKPPPRPLATTTAALPANNPFSAHFPS